MLRYSVKLSRDTNGTILVDVPAIPEAHTFGEDRDEALARAVDAIETALMGYIEDRRGIPQTDVRRARRISVALPALSEAKSSSTSPCVRPNRKGATGAAPELRSAPGRRPP